VCKYVFYNHQCFEIIELDVLSGHTNTVHEVHYLRSQPHVSFSCSSDGTLRFWDVRQSSPVRAVSAGAAELFTCGANCQDTVVAAGTENEVLFWYNFCFTWHHLCRDLRTFQQLGRFTESHTNEVTQVRFHPTLPGKLFSGAVDGLINVMDVTASSEDDALFGGCDLRFIMF